MSVARFSPRNERGSLATAVLRLIFAAVFGTTGFLLGGFFWLLAFRLMNTLSFFQRGWRWLVFLALAPFFGLLFPVALYYLDRIDHEQDHTLGYFCWCEKPGGDSGSRRQTETNSL